MYPTYPLKPNPLFVDAPDINNIFPLSSFPNTLQFNVSCDILCSASPSVYPVYFPMPSPLSGAYACVGVGLYDT